MGNALYTPKPPPPEVLQQLEQNPLNSEAWRKFLAQRQEERDTLASQALTVISKGVEEIVKPGSGGQQDSQLRLADKLSVEELRLFTNAAKAYHDSRKLSELGNLYLRKLRRPDLARQHFKQASHLGSSNREEYEQLLAKCEEAEKEQVAGTPLEFTDMTATQSCKPAVASFFKRSGKLAAPNPNQAVDDDPAAGVAAVAQNDARTVDALINQALVLTEQGMAPQAASLLNRAHQLGIGEQHVTDACDAWTSVATLYFSRRDMPRAARAYDQACRLIPNCMESWFNLGTSLHHAGNYEHAQRCYEYADKLEPDHPKVLCNLGAMYFQSDNLPAAEQCMRRSVGRKPDYARAWHNLGTVLGARGKLSDACDALQKALALQPDNAEAAFKLGMIYYDQDNYDAALHSFRECLNRGVSQGYSWLYMSLIMCRRGQLDEAIKMCQQGLDADPENEVGWIALNELGLAMIQAGQFSAGIDLLNQSAEISPNKPVVYLNLGIAHFNVGKHEEARRFLAEAASLDKDLSAAWHALGLIEANEGNIEKAIQAFRTVTNLSPRDPRGWYDLGVGLERQLNFRESRSAIGKAMQLSQAVKLDNSDFQKAHDAMRERLSQG